MYAFIAYQLFTGYREGKELGLWNTEKPQITQGYYKPTYHPRLKMNSTALFDIYKKGSTDSIEPRTYYLAMANGQKTVFEKMPGGWSQSRELYIPEHYTIG